MNARWLLVTVYVLLSLAGRADAQPIFAHTESIECTIANADLVVVGKVIELEEGDFAEGATIEVEQTIKGQHRDKLRMEFTYEVSILAKWKEDSHRLLVAARGEPAHPTQIIDLSDESVALMTADFQAIEKPEKIIKAAKEAHRRMPGIKKIDTFQHMLPPEVVAGTKWAEYHATMLTVPVDERLEKRAQKYLLSEGPKHYLQRVEAASALRYFKSDENIARVKTLLHDPGWSYKERAKEGRGVEVRYYGVRQAAYETLKYWGVETPKPKTHEKSWKPELVTFLAFSFTEDWEKELDKLDRFPNLQDLLLSNVPVTDSHLKPISKVTGLRTLDLSSSKITDAGLKSLAGLKDLRALDLMVTEVTDAGLKELAGLKKLKSLHLDGTRVTDAALKELAGFSQLEELSLNRTRVSDAGVKDLAKIPNLKELSLEDTDVTVQGVAELRKLKSDLTIDH